MPSSIVGIDEAPYPVQSLAVLARAPAMLVNRRVPGALPVGRAGLPRPGPRQTDESGVGHPMSSRPSGLLWSLPKAATPGELRQPAGWPAPLSSARPLVPLLVAAVAFSVGPAGATAPVDPATVPAAADSDAAATELVFSLIPPSDGVAGGDALQVELLALNPGEREVAFGPPAVLTASASACGLSRTVVLRADSARATTIAPSGSCLQR